MTALAGQKLRASYLQGLEDDVSEVANPVTKYGYRLTTSSASSGTATQTCLRLDNIPWVAGETWEVRYRGHPDGTAGHNFRAEARFNAAGVATTASTILVGTQSFEPIGAQREFAALISIGVSGNYSVLLTFADATSGAASWFCDANRITELIIERKGVVANSGVPT